MAAVVEGCLYLAGILLLGAGVTSRFVLPSLRDAASSPRMRLGVVAGAAVLVAGSAIDIVLTLHGALGFLDAPLVRNYLTSTRHGHATLARLGLAMAAVALALPAPGRREAKVGEGDDPDAGVAWSAGDVLFALVGVALLATFSWTSHAAAMAGTPALLADLVHFGAATVWAGPILYLALHPRWHEERPALRRGVRRISRIGLVSVLLLFATGAYSALLHVQDPERFVASPYGRALGAKLVVVIVIIAVAAVNRLWLLPAFLRDDRSLRLRDAVRAESLLLVAVFLLTGVLATSALPHEGGAQATVAENLAGLVRYLTGR